MNEKIAYAVKGLLGSLESRIENEKLIICQYKGEAIPYIIDEINKLDNSFGYEPWVLFTEVLESVVGHSQFSSSVTLDIFSQIVPLVHDKNVWARGTAALYFGWTAQDVRALQYLITLYYDEDYGVRRVALDSLSKHGEQALWDLKNLLDNAERQYEIDRSYTNEIGRLKTIICDIWNPKFYPRDWSSVIFKKPYGR